MVLMLNFCTFCRNLLWFCMTLCADIWRYKNKWIDFTTDRSGSGIDPTSRDVPNRSGCTLTAPKRPTGEQRWLLAVRSPHTIEPGLIDSDRSDHVTFPRLPLSNKIPFTALYPLLLRPDAVLMWGNYCRPRELNIFELWRCLPNGQVWCQH